MGNVRGYMWGAALCALIAAMPAPAHADPDAASRNIKAELAAKQAEKAETEKKAKALSSEVTKIKSRLVDASGSLRKLEDDLDQTDKKLASLQAQKKQQLLRLSRDEAAISDLVSAAHKYHSTPTPMLVLQGAPVDAARAALVFKTILPDLHAQSADLRQQLAELERIESDISDNLAKNKKELSKYNNEQKELQSLLEERRNLYKKTEASRKAQEREVANLAKEAKSLDDLVAKIQQKPTVRPQADDDGDAAPAARSPVATARLEKAVSRYALPSSIKQPVSGTVRVGFGEKDDLGANSKGVTFTTRAGATVVTPLSGKVRFAGPFQKYKQILIVEHQGGYHSLIAGLGRIDTVVGASLAAGEPVGAAETSVSDALIYYELRHNGKAVNPQKMTTAQRKQEKT